MRRLFIVSISVVVCFFSLLGVIIAARTFGFASSDFHNPNKILDPLTLTTALAVLVVPIFIVICSQRFFIRKPLGKIGLCSLNVSTIAKGFVIGTVLKLFATAGAYLWSPSATAAVSTQGVSIFDWAPYFIWFVIALLLNSLNEELVYRTFPVENLGQGSRSSGLATVFLSALAFSWMHFLIEEPNLGKFFYRLLFGILAGLLYLGSRSLWLIVGLHSGWNFIALAASDTDWRTGTLVHIGGLEPGSEILFNCIVLSIATGVVFFRKKRIYEVAYA